jgi:hypothetical protein
VEEVVGRMDEDEMYDTMAHFLIDWPENGGA